MGHKRDHHVIPRLYLKGFAESGEKPFIWVYTKGRSFNPGGGSLVKYNPARMPIRKAAVIPYAYSFTNDDGVFDADTYENELERLEKPSDLIFHKIRRRQMITKEEKAIFADYVFLIRRRVPEPEEEARRNWQDFLGNWELLKAMRSNDIWPRLSEEQRRDVDGWLETYKDAPPREARLKAITHKSEPVNLHLRKMTWRFLVPTGPSMFISGDRPVAITGLGLVKLLSELTFPISSDITLHVSWQPGEEGFFYAPENWVKQLNQRMATNCSQVFAHRSEEWIAKILNRGNYPIYLLNFVKEFEGLWPYRHLPVPQEWLQGDEKLE